MGSPAHAKESGEAGITIDQLAQSFGLLIAYVCPGFVTIAGIRPDLISKIDSAVTLVLALVGSAAVGVFLGGVAFLVFDKSNLFFWIAPYCKVVFPSPTDFPEAVRGNASIESAYRDIRDQHYRYYQFYAATAIGLGIVAVWNLQQKIGAHTAFGPKTWGVGIAIVLAFIVTIPNALIQLARFCERRNDLLTGKKD